MQENEEMWLPFRDTAYYVSSKGRVASSLTNQIINSRLNGGKKRQYNRVSIYEDDIELGGKIKKDYYVSNMVAETFIANPYNFDCVDHINNDSTDDSVENLRWCTNQQNQDFRWSMAYNKRLINDLREYHTECNVAQNNANK